MLAEVYPRLLNTATLFTLALSVWGFVRFFRGQGVDGSYLGALVIAEVLIIIQTILGVLYFMNGAPLDNPAMYALYELCLLVCIPAFYAYVQGQDSRREMLLWALVTFFVFGLTLRTEIVMG